MTSTIFEQTGGSYIQQGDYLLPDLKLPEQKENNIGVWGMRYKRWLKSEHRVLYYNLLTKGKLNERLAEVDEWAVKRFDWLVYEMAWKEKVDEELKADDPMKWVRHMNNIRQRVTEIVLDEILAI